MVTRGAGEGSWRTGVAVLGLGGLAGLAGLTLVAAGAGVFQTVGLDYAEPVIYGQAMRLVSGEPLYQPLDQPPFTVAAYTPLYYALGALLQSTVGSGFAPGRLLSLAAGVVTALLVGVTAGRRNGGAWVGACAAVLFLGLAFPGPVPWLGLYRVDLVGVMLSVAAVALLTRSTSPLAFVAAGVLAGLAVLCKQTFVAAFLAGTLWAWRDWPTMTKMAAFAGSALLTVGIPGVLFEVTTGGAFLQNTVVANVNPFHPAIAAGLAPIFLAAQWLPLLLALVYLVVGRPWRTSDARLLVLYWGLSGASLLGLAKVGAGSNYWIEFAAVTAILAARGSVSVLNSSRRVVAVAAIVGLVLLSGHTVNAARLAVGTIRSDVETMSAAARQAEFNALVERVRHAPGAVLAEPMDVVVLAGRPVLLEPFIYNLLLDAGRWQPAGLVARICNGDIALLVLAYPLDVGARMTDGLYALWPAPVMTALQRSMEPDGVAATRYVYRPRASPAPGCRNEALTSQLVAAETEAIRTGGDSARRRSTASG
jgi:hypothetical protein